jgi:hypothetical protein
LVASEAFRSAFQRRGRTVELRIAALQGVAGAIYICPGLLVE